MIISDFIINYGQRERALRGESAIAYVQLLIVLRFLTVGEEEPDNDEHDRSELNIR